MGDRFLLKIAAPMVAISLLLVGLGAVAAWNVHRQQSVTSALIASEVEGVLAAHDLYVGMRDVRRKLHEFVRTGDRLHVDTIPELYENTRSRLETAVALAHTDEERTRIAEVERGYERFWSEFERIRQHDTDLDRSRALGELLEDMVTQDILEPGEQYIDVNRQVVERTNEASRVTSEQMKQGFLLLGVCGGAGGLIAGLGIARAVSRSIVQLEVSVHSAAGRLNSIAGPIRISRVGGSHELEAGLNRIEAHIADLVQRLQRSELEVLRNEQLAAVGQLAASIAHELRNPLMPMKMLVQAALERDDGRGLCGRPLHVVDEEIGRLEHAIQALVEFARPAPPGKRRSTSFPQSHRPLSSWLPGPGSRTCEFANSFPTPPSKSPPMAAKSGKFS
jgi:C4-dicarboxylate-specific signal transduction histidine kinase